MPLLPRVRSLWRTLFQQRALDRELDDEIAAAAEALADRYVSTGMNRQAARRAAINALGGSGGVGRVKEDVREGRIGAGLDVLLLDLRHAWRRVWKAPGLTAVIVATLALGIGANVAIFSIVHALLLKPMPYRNADRLLFVWLNRPDLGGRGPLSGPDLRDLREGSRTVAEFGAIWATGTVALTGNGDPEQLRAAFVSPNFFQVLGAESALGRTFRAEDSAPGAQPTVLLGWDLFERRFGADASIVGQQILVNDQPTTVVGVMPPAFRLLLPTDSAVPDRLQVWAPFWHDFEDGDRGALFLRVVGRMRPGVTVAEARADVGGIGRRIGRELRKPRAFNTLALQTDGVRDVRGPLLVLFVGVGLLLTIACVNVAGLLIARAASHARETALRLALGATRRRLLGHTVVEGLLLTGLGAVAGVLVGSVGLHTLIALAPESLSRMETSRINLAVLGFTLAISVVWGLLCSLASAVELFKARPNRTLQWGSRSAGKRLRYRTRALLVTGQIALSLVLLVGAGLLVRAFVEVQRVDPGFRTERHLTFRVALPAERYSSTEALVAAAAALHRRLAALPGVTDVGAMSHLPYDDLPNWALRYSLDSASSEDGSANARTISTGLFETLGVELVDGRFFTDDEHEEHLVVIVDDILARRLWRGRSAVGQQLLLGQTAADRRATVVGVVRHLRLRSLVEDFTPQVFLPYRVWQRSPMAYVIRTDGDPASLAADVRATVTAFDRRLPIYDTRPMVSYVQAARSIRHFTMLLAAAFAAAALVLTGIGVHGVLAYAVASRRHELGVRKALGAGTARIVHEVMREGLGFAVGGSAAGVVGAAMAAGLLQSQLYAVDPHDPMAYGVSLALVLCGAAIASWIPAQRALAISPMDALRTD